MAGTSATASPNLWDAQTDNRYDMSHKGLDGVRFYRGALGDNGAMAQDYSNAGNAAMTQAMDMYGAQAMGTAPSLAQGTMQQGLEANNRAAMGLMGQARGGNVAGAYQQALGAQSGANMQTMQQGAINAMAEQQAGLAGYAGLAGQSAALGQNYAQLASQHQLQADQNDLGWYGAKRGMDMQRDQGNRDFTMGLVNAGVNTLGSVLSAVGSMSDERAKMGMQPASVADAAAEMAPDPDGIEWRGDPISEGQKSAVRQSLRHFGMLGGQSRGASPASQAAEVGGLGYEYQPGLGQPGGQQYGVSAQQLAQTSLGPTLVHPGPDGLLRVDGERAGIAGLAASGENTRRIQQLEQQLAMATGDGSDEQRYGTAEQGAMRTRDAAQRSSEIAMQRGLGQVQRARGGPPTDFGRMPTMQRGGFDRGNIDLRSQPQVRNPDGSISTVDSSSYNIGGRETLLPSVTPDGRHLQSGDDIVREYERTGRHLGRFGSPEAADSYARELHEAYASGALDRPYAIDPFEDDAPPMRPAPQGLGPRTMPRRRPGLQGAMPERQAMRGQAVGFGNEPYLDAQYGGFRGLPGTAHGDVQSFQEPHYEGDVGGANAFNGPRQVDVQDADRAAEAIRVEQDQWLTAPNANGLRTFTGRRAEEWQPAIDAMRDYNDEWISRDEAGRPVFTGSRMNLSDYPSRGDMRSIEQVEEMDFMEQVEAEKARLRGLPSAGRV